MSKHKINNKKLEPHFYALIVLTKFFVCIKKNDFVPFV